MREIILIVHDIRSCHNVGSLLRTAEGLGITKVYFTGYTPYPKKLNDQRLPHIALKLTSQISKTALGAEDTQPWEQHTQLEPILKQLSADGFMLVALEQTPTAVQLPNYVAPQKIALLLGSEVEGISPELLLKMDETVVIPMFGQKESFNVVQAAAMALYHLRFN